MEKRLYGLGLVNLKSKNQTTVVIKKKNEIIYKKNIIALLLLLVLFLFVVFTFLYYLIIYLFNFVSLENCPSSLLHMVWISLFFDRMPVSVVNSFQSIHWLCIIFENSDHIMYVTIVPRFLDCDSCFSYFISFFLVHDFSIYMNIDT
jgi:hypothetical protein